MNHFQRSKTFTHDINYNNNDNKRKEKLLIMKHKQSPITSGNIVIILDGIFDVYQYQKNENDDDVINPIYYNQYFQLIEKETSSSLKMQTTIYLYWIKNNNNKDDDIDNDYNEKNEIFYIDKLEIVNDNEKEQIKIMNNNIENEIMYYLYFKKKEEGKNEFKIWKKLIEHEKCECRFIKIDLNDDDNDHNNNKNHHDGDNEEKSINNTMEHKNQEQEICKRINYTKQHMERLEEEFIQLKEMNIKKVENISDKIEILSNQITDIQLLLKNTLFNAKKNVKNDTNKTKKKQKNHNCAKCFPFNNNGD